MCRAPGRGADAGLQTGERACGAAASVRPIRPTAARASFYPSATTAGPRIGTPGWHKPYMRLSGRATAFSRDRSCTNPQLRTRIAGLTVVSRHLTVDVRRQEEGGRGPRTESPAVVPGGRKSGGWIRQTLSSAYVSSDPRGWSEPRSRLRSCDEGWPTECVGQLLGPTGEEWHHPNCCPQGNSTVGLTGFEHVRDSSGACCLTGPFALFSVVNPALRRRRAEAHGARRARFRT